MNKAITVLKYLLRARLEAGTELQDSYHRTFARTVVGDETKPALAFWRGRVALWTILRAAGIKEGDEVILPAYTCEMVPTAVKFAGATCVYVDVEEGRFNPSVRQVAEAVTDRTRAIICQHTYGIAQPIGEFSLVIAGRDAVLIEDCCQLISRNSRFPGIAVTGHAAFFSTQWSKPFSTGLGGMAVFNDETLYRAAQELVKTFSHKSDSQRARSLAFQVLAYELLVRPKTKAVIAGIYRWAQKKGLVQGTTTTGEYEGKMPEDYLALGINLQAALGMNQLQKWGENVQHRQKLTKFYLERLGEWGGDIAPFKIGSDDPVLWAVPVFVENVDEMLSKAGREGLPISTWFGPPPVHIQSMSAGFYDYRPGQCPKSEKLFPREIHLLTAPSVTMKQAERGMEFIRKYARRSSF